MVNATEFFPSTNQPSGSHILHSISTDGGQSDILIAPDLLVPSPLAENTVGTHTYTTHTHTHTLSLT